MDIFLAPLHPQLEVLALVTIAMALGGVIGIERELSNKPAGFRTHTLVAGAAALLIGLADALALHFYTQEYNDVLRIEPIRVVEAIITGVSILGAGTIFRRDREGWVEGLTTAASVLFASAIGIAVALEQLVLAASVTVLVLTVLSAMGFIERRFRRIRE